jgi:hypothetical protein
MNIRNNIKSKVERNILKNYQEVLEAEKNHPEDFVTFNSVDGMKKYFDSL